MAESAARVEHFDNGWDVAARLVDGTWVERSPRRPEVAPALRREAELLSWLGPRLPVPVPQPEVVSQAPLRVRHRLVPGAPCDGREAAHGTQIGGLLHALHAVTVAEARELGLPDSGLASLRSRFEDEVLSRLSPELVARAAALLDRCATSPRTALIHGDLGPDHVRVADGRVAEVIDWVDACVGDPAQDLAWLLHGTSPAFVEGVASAYRVDQVLWRRALDWHALGPWHQVLHGRDTGDDALADDGLAGVLDRLALLPDGG